MKPTGKMNVNWSLYLVTDSTKAVLGHNTLLQVVREALDGGVTVVQYRDKTSGTAELIKTARELHYLTQKYHVPLIINDRVDVALAVGAEGVHIGQKDMDVATVRRLMGPDAIVGVTCSNFYEAGRAALAGATYLSLGMVFASSSNEDMDDVIGTSGVRGILQHLSAMTEEGTKRLATVAIGGIDYSNVQRVLYQTRATFKKLDGVAVLSAIMGAVNPESSALELRSMMTEKLPYGTSAPDITTLQDVSDLLAKVPGVVKRLGEIRPVCLNMTNVVIQNFAANIALAIGACPIMSNDSDEAEDLGTQGGALVINIGTMTADSLSDYLRAMKSYNHHGGPILLDPVGCNATMLRKNAVVTLLAGGWFQVIKGNTKEIMAILRNSDDPPKPVDGAERGMTYIDKARAVKQLAIRERNIVVMTGEIDFISDGERVYYIANGHHYLGQITGGGCTLGTTIAAFTAVEQEDKLLAVMAAMLLFEIAAERAALQPTVQGPGTFVPAFIDSLGKIASQAGRGDTAWLKFASVKAVDVQVDPNLKKSPNSRTNGPETPKVSTSQTSA